MNETLEQYIRQRHTKQTADSYLYEIDNFKSINPKCRWYKYTDIVTYLENLKTKYPNVSSRTRILSAIKKYYDYLLESGKRNDHPCRTIKIKRKKHYIQTQDLFTRDELMILFNRENRYEILEIRNKLIISLLVFQGLTSEDIIKLNVQNIDLDEGSITIKATSKLKKRDLELDRTQIQLISKYLNEVRPKLLKQKTNRLILGKLGTEISVDGLHSIFDQFKTLYSDRKLNPSTIRQSTISYWLNVKKYPVEDVQDLAGHKYPSATEAYRMLDDIKSRVWINKFHPLG
jgi:integrase/recombinase XerD